MFLLSLFHADLLLFILLAGIPRILLMVVIGGLAVRLGYLGLIGCEGSYVEIRSGKFGLIIDLFILLGCVVDLCMMDQDMGIIFC